MKKSRTHRAVDGALPHRVAPVDEGPLQEGNQRELRHRPPPFEGRWSGCTPLGAPPRVDNASADAGSLSYAVKPRRVDVRVVRCLQRLNAADEAINPRS